MSKNREPLFESFHSIGESLSSEMKKIRMSLKMMWGKDDGCNKHPNGGSDHWSMRWVLLNFDQKQLNISSPYNRDRITWKVWFSFLAEVRQGKVKGVNNMSGSVNMWLISKLIEKKFRMNVEGEVMVTIVIMELSKHARSTLLDYPGRLKETENQRLNLRLSIQMVLSDMIARSRMHSLIHISI